MFKLTNILAISFITLLMFELNAQDTNKQSENSNTTNISKAPEHKMFKRKNGKWVEANINKSDTDMLPSWTTCRGTSGPLYSEDYWLFMCSNCQLTFEVEIDDDSYDLHPASHSGTYPKLQLLNATEGVPVSVPFDFTLEFRAPEIAAIYNIKVTWTYPGSNPPIPPSTSYVTVNVYVPELYDASPAGVVFTNITSHPSNGTYMSEDAALALTNVVPAYQFLAASDGVPTGNIPGTSPPIPYIRIPTSEGASLNYGGLFDINKNFSHPHCQHRQGLNIDIGMSQYKTALYKDELLEALEDAFLYAGYSFPVTNEAPNSSPTEWAKPNFHWHATYPGGY